MPKKPQVKGCWDICTVLPNRLLVTAKGKKMSLYIRDLAVTTLIKRSNLLLMVRLPNIYVAVDVLQYEVSLWSILAKNGNIKLTIPPHLSIHRKQV